MSNDPQEAPLALPARPSLRHLKHQAKDLLESGAADSLADAQFTIARRYGFASWPKLKAHVDATERTAQLEQAYYANDVERIRTLLAEIASDLVARGKAESIAAAQAQIATRYGFENWMDVEAQLESLRSGGDSGAHSVEVTQLGRAIDLDDVARVQDLMTRDAALHRAPLGYGRGGPLTCAAGGNNAPSAARLAIVRWMLEHGSDVHQGGDAPLMRAAGGRRFSVMELLVEHGADVNARWNGNFPILFAPCENVDPDGIKWLLDRGANPNAGSPDGTFADTALDYVIGSYVRSPHLAQCINLLLDAGGITKHNAVVLDLLRGKLDQLAERVDADPAMVTRRFPGLDFGTTGGRMLTLTGATLLHVAAEYGNIDAATLLLNRGADVNARATVDSEGVGGQTPIFHAATQFEDRGMAMMKFLIERGADLSVRARVPGHYERPGEIIECTPLGYAIRFQDETRAGDKTKTVALLRERGGMEWSRIYSGR